MRFSAFLKERRIMFLMIGASLIPSILSELFQFPGKKMWVVAAAVALLLCVDLYFWLRAQAIQSYLNSNAPRDREALQHALQTAMKNFWIWPVSRFF